MARVAVIGGGVMGLSVAYYALKAGHQVTVYEADKVPGGMAAHFDFNGLSLERYFHFVCKADKSTFELMAELGLQDRLCWVSTTMGTYAEGRVHEWGNPLALLKCPFLSPIEKLRYGLMMFSAIHRRYPGRLENMTSKAWIERWCGNSIYTKLWKPLFDLKFYQYADNISAAWLWTRIKRVGTSRRSMMQEELGYITGGSETLVHALVSRIESLGGEVRLGAKVEEALIEEGRVAGIKSNGKIDRHDAVVSTVPTPLVSGMAPNLPEALKETYRAIKNIGVVCLVIKLKRSVTPHFWMNVSDPDIAIPGFVEYSNLRPLAQTVVYIPYYMPIDNLKWRRSDAEFVEEGFNYLKRINPLLTKADIVDTAVGRLLHAQPVCEPGFGKKIPDAKTAIAGLQIADTSFYYPEDRGISESIRWGKLLASGICDSIGYRQA